jgi:hypothetical protein
MTPFYVERNFSVSEIFISWVLVTIRDDGVYPFKDEAQTALFKDPVRTEL